MKHPHELERGNMQQGWPPAVTLANWQDPPVNRWSFLHVNEILSTAPISRLGAPVTPLVRAARPILDVPVSSQNSAIVTVADILDTTETDAFLLLQDGKLIHESYAPSMTANAAHLLMSVTKSFVGAIAGILAERRVLDLDRPIMDHIPEVIGFGYENATARHLLDMRSGVTFSEDYLNPESQVRMLERAASWRPDQPGAPAAMYGYLAHLPAHAPHGGAFNYRSGETDVLGWVCERASGSNMASLLSTLIWQRLGMEHDAYITVDSSGAPVHDGGLCSTARDLARFGQLLLDDGKAPSGAQILPTWWTADTLTGGADSAAAFEPAGIKSGMPGGHYRNQLWVPVSGEQTLLALGIYGQMVYVNRATRTVGVKLSSWPAPQNAARFFSTLAAFRAIATHVNFAAEPSRVKEKA